MEYVGVNTEVNSLQTVRDHFNAIAKKNSDALMIKGELIANLMKQLVLNGLPPKTSVYVSESQIDLSIGDGLLEEYLSLDTVLNAVLPLCPNGIKKTISWDNQRFIYTAKIDNISIYFSGLPPSCRIVEKKTIVPAVPEHEKVVHEIVCSS